MAGGAPLSEESCTGCLIGPLDISLVLTCSHRLCLDCARSQLNWPRNGDPTAVCPRCGTVTEVDHTAAQHICDRNASQRQSSAPKAVAEAVALWPSQQSAVSPRDPGFTRGPTPPRLASWSTQLGTPPRESAPFAGAERPTLPIGLAPAHADRNSVQREPSWSLAAVPQPAVSQHSPVEASCGQCQAALAELDCFQCGEQFCGRCAASMHRSGRMREHKLVPLRKEANGSAAITSDCGLLPQPSMVESRHRHPVKFCAVHPEEPVQFFCLDCDSECICAECAVQRDGVHHGHEVINLRVAYQKLAREITVSLEAARERSAENARAVQQADVLRQDLDLVIGQGKRSMQEAFEKCRISLQQKEHEIVAGVEECRVAADTVLAERAGQAEQQTGEVREAHGALRSLEPRGGGDGEDEVKALNSYAAARAAVARLLDPSEAGGPDSTDLPQLIENLKSQVHDALKKHSANVAALSENVPEIRRAGTKVASPNLPEMG